MTKNTALTFVLILLFMITGSATFAQFTSATLGVNGLTCSQCSRSVEVELKKLSFVQSVNMDLEHTKGTIVFKKQTKADMAAIAKAVKNAGFSVRFLEAKLDKGSIATTGERCFKYKGEAYQLLKPLNNSSIATLRFIGKEYMPARELKNYKIPTDAGCSASVRYVADVL